VSALALGRAPSWPRVRAQGGSCPTVRTIQVDGVTARYLCLGSGAPVLLVASPLVPAWSYERVMRALASTFTVIVLELPGAGASERLEHAWTPARYGAWIVEMVRRLPLARPVLIGHGDAASAVACAARLAPGDIAALVLAVRSVDGTRSGVGSALAGHAPLRRVPRMLANALRHRRTFLEHLRADPGELVRAVRDLSVPTLLACGDGPGSSSLASASRLRTSLPSARLLVGAASRDWLTTAPDAFAEGVRRFLAGARDPSRRLHPGDGGGT